MPIIGGLGLLVLALWIFCIIDVITSSEWEVRNLPKMGWLLIVLLLPTVGSIVWLVAGRPQTGRGWASPQRSTPPYPEYDRPGRHVAANPEDDAEFLRRCRERAEQQRRAAREKRRLDEET
ncbi:MAG TPA: PLD nuclease N-terminal domain-containing protein [Actinophytocola sp.]|uniref:PLD nuclease N-terminal domain-containing protein n=1 Tax=Actinophytocola sp. TaxID=1872138 RepID=UPI002DDDB0FB|nr:PLD nuclease N-terminal domain-containing protein [Actinophytocola sp.]HEV2782453.1 PLD nuclease N-terminal domain-containing protein [Actinophytocola sp.]